MPEVDKRRKLEAQPFDYQITKNRRVLIYRDNHIIMTLKDKAAQKLISKLDDADETAVQLALAKVTGHFKHGNERSS